MSANVCPQTRAAELIEWGFRFALPHLRGQ